MDTKKKDLIRVLADKYETKDFLKHDPSKFMHMVEGDLNREVTAFLASCFSYGLRGVFMMKIDELVDLAHSDLASWVVNHTFENDLPDTTDCFYRVNNFRQVRATLTALGKMIDKYGSIGGFVKDHASTGMEAIRAFCSYFALERASFMVPLDSTSACKRLCMYLRWMVRDNSPVDLGLWSSFVDKSTLIMPLDTHVMREAWRFGLITSTTTTMAAAKRLTVSMLDIFPDDPLKGDFALFGLGAEQIERRRGMPTLYDLRDYD